MSERRRSRPFWYFQSVNRASLLAKSERAIARDVLWLVKPIIDKQSYRVSHDDHHSVACRMAFCGRLFIADNWLDTCKKLKILAKKPSEIGTGNCQ